MLWQLYMSWMDSSSICGTGAGLFDAPLSTFTLPRTVRYIKMWSTCSPLLFVALLKGAHAVADGYTRQNHAYAPVLIALRLLCLCLPHGLLCRDRNPNYPPDLVDKLEEATMPKVEAYLEQKIAAGKNNECTLETASVRREWSVSHLFGSPQKSHLIDNLTGVICPKNGGRNMLRQSSA